MTVADKIGIATLIVASLTLVVAAVALWVAARTLTRGNRNASASTVLTLNESFRQAWERYLSASEAGDQVAKKTALGELANLLELASGMLHENTLAGVSKDIAEDYLRSVLLFFEREDLRDELLALQEKRTTFQYIRAFISKGPRASSHPSLAAGLAATAALRTPTKPKPNG